MSLESEIPRKEFFRVAMGLVGAALARPGWASDNASGQPAAQGAADKFAERILSDTAAAMLSFGAYIGDRLGIYRAMADAGPATVSELAARIHLNERYLREWLALMATAGYVRFDAATSRYRLTRAQW